MTRDEILKALGYSDARIEAIERSGHQTVRLDFIYLAIDIPQEVIRLADALADDGMASKIAIEDDGNYQDGCNCSACCSVRGQIALINAYRYAVIERVKGSE